MSTIGIDELVADLRSISDQLDVELDGVDLTESSSLQSDLDMDSLNMIDFLVFLEKKYQVKIEDSQLSTVATLGDVLSLLNGLVTAR